MIMKNIYKKIAVLGLTLLVTSSVMAGALTRFLPLLSGYNVLVTTNAAVGFGVTNTLNTSYNGQIIHSITNDVFNGTLNTNVLTPDAFRVISLEPDANGDINANAYVTVMIGNTNYIPIAITNSVGQWFVPTQPYTTNYATAGYATVWPLGINTGPSWMSPATTNLYPGIPAASTNAWTITLYRAGTTKLQGGLGADQAPYTPMWETTGAFSFSVAATGVTPVCVITNLPVGWLQGARFVYATVSGAANLGSNGGTNIVNQLGIVQPQP